MRSSLPDFIVIAHCERDFVMGMADPRIHVVLLQTPATQEVYAQLCALAAMIDEDPALDMHGVAEGRRAKGLWLDSIACVFPKAMPQIRMSNTALQKPASPWHGDPKIMAVIGSTPTELLNVPPMPREEWVTLKYQAGVEQGYGIITPQPGQAVVLIERKRGVLGPKTQAVHRSPPPGPKARLALVATQ